jgi:uncharacterized SAM-binding protein YcdF (DUF218 family)
VGPARKTILRLLLAFVLLAGLSVLSSPLWLPIVGRALIHDDGPAPAPIAVVLAGDFTGVRLEGAADLARRGFVPQILVSGPPGMYGINEADAGIRFMVAKGCPAEWFIPIYHKGTSTRDEARVMLAELDNRKIRNFILVTSNYHTGRARRIYLDVERERGGGPTFRVVAVADPVYNPEAWWHSREGRKAAFFEWTKTLTALVGI